jgi:3'-phosphoadenosine 5'-phosphosulfate sulfotransferase (PAPS reductase)/FAD synthetase
MGDGTPFLITGPAVISFSGGRTSAYMLWRILQAHDGTLPDDVLVCFANTGREHEGTLRFVHDCATHWGVRVRWLEFRNTLATEAATIAWRIAQTERLTVALAKAKTPAAEARIREHLRRIPMKNAPGTLWAEEVGFNSAAREGEPFEALLRQRKFLPNPVSRFCTTELKIRTIRRWCVQQLGKAITWTQVVGLRADEPSRVDRIMDPARQKKSGRQASKVVVPLHAAGVTEEDVLAFWAAQPFDLMLAGPWEGNCDGCFLKRKAFIGLAYREHPDRMPWWDRMEREYASPLARRKEIGQFRKDWKGGYAAIRDSVQANPLLIRPPALDDDGLDRFASCDVGCGA